jgi:hypothetical protein
MLGGGEIYIQDFGQKSQGEEHLGDLDVDGGLY